MSRRSLVATATASALLAFRPGARAAQDARPAWQEGEGLQLAGPVMGPPSLDPALSNETQSNFLLQQLYRGLVSVDEHLEVVPELASSVELSADANRVDVTLRPDARFHDGRAVTPADVVASFTRALDPRTVGGDVNLLVARGFLGDIEGADRLMAGTASTLDGCEITGDSTLSITLSRPSPAFLAKLTSVPASIVDATQVADDPDWHLHPNGSGPYRLESWVPADSIIMQPAGTWWGGAPVTGSLQFRLGSSAVLPTNLYQAGDVDVVWSVPPEIVDLVQDPGSGFQIGNLTEVGLFSTMYVALSNQVPPLDDAHVRRALQRVFPVANVAKVMFQGTVAEASGLVPPGMNGREWDVSYPEVDVEAARAELAQSRYGAADRVPVISVHAADIRPVEALRDVAREALGLRVEAVEVAWPDFLAGLAQQRYMAHAMHWTADFPDAASLLEMLFASSSRDNGSGYASQAFDGLIDEARASKGDDRLDALEAANRYLIEDVAVIPLYHDIGHALVREGISGLRVTPIGLLGLESVRGSP